MMMLSVSRICLTRLWMRWMDREGGGQGRYILSLINSLDNKNTIIVDLLVEITRLRKLLKDNGINPEKSK